MSSQDSLVQAFLNRLSARFGKSLSDFNSRLAVLVEETPGWLRKEWELFQEEVIAEADRLEKNDFVSTEDEDIEVSSKTPFD